MKFVYFPVLPYFGPHFSNTMFEHNVFCVLSNALVRKGSTLIYKYVYIYTYIYIYVNVYIYIYIYESIYVC